MAKSSTNWLDKLVIQTHVDANKIETLNENYYMRHPTHIVINPITWHVHDTYGTQHQLLHRLGTKKQKILLLIKPDDAEIPTLLTNSSPP